MKESKQPIRWEGNVVGYIENLNFDNFDLYGKWKPVTSEATEKFLELLRAEEQLVVQVGSESANVIFTVEFEPTETIEIKIRPKTEST
jgi:hypothetical protein